MSGLLGDNSMAYMNRQGNIQPLNEAGRSELEFRQQELAYQRAIYRRRIVYFGLAMLVVTIFSMIQYHGQYVKYNSAVQSNAQMQKNLDKATAENKQYTQTAKDLQKDDYLQKVVRERHLYTKDGETVFNLPTN